MIFHLKISYCEKSRQKQHEHHAINELEKIKSQMVLNYPMVKSAMIPGCPDGLEILLTASAVWFHKLPSIDGSRICKTIFHDLQQKNSAI